MSIARYRIITNNPSVQARWTEACHWVDGGVSDVFQKARDLVHIGHRLLTHPLAGSVKPNATLYRSIIVTDDSACAVDIDSLRIIEGSIATLKRLGPPRFTSVPPSIDADFQLIDEVLMESAIDSLHTGGFYQWRSTNAR